MFPLFKLTRLEQFCGLRRKARAVGDCAAKTEQHCRWCPIFRLTQHKVQSDLLLPSPPFPAACLYPKGCKEIRVRRFLVVGQFFLWTSVIGRAKETKWILRFLLLWWLQSRGNGSSGRNRYLLIPQFGFVLVSNKVKPFGTIGTRP